MFSNVGLDSKIYRIFFVVVCFMGFAGVLKAKDLITATLTVREKLEKECNVKHDAKSCSALGGLYITSMEPARIKQDEKKALEYLNKGCDFGDTESCRMLHRFYYNGYYDGGHTPLKIKKDVAKAVTYAIKGCNYNDTGLCKVMAEYYYIGEGVKKDLTKAIEYYAKACNGGYSDVCYTLGDMYYNGKDVAKDINKAKEYFTKVCVMSGSCEKSCELNNYESCATAGDGLFKRHYIPEAIEYYTKSCDGGIIRSCAALGNAYSIIESPKYNVDKAIIYYTKACDSGINEACNSLGDAYYGLLNDSHSTNNKQDVNKAITYYAKACSSGVNKACDNLKEVYGETKDAEVDFNVMFESFAKACDKDIYVACNALSDMYFKGEGVKFDIDKGSEYYKKSCKGYTDDYCNRVGNLYYYYGQKFNSDRQGDNKDIDKAVAFFTKACDAGVAEACIDLGYTEQNTNKNIDKALTYYAKACSSGNERACYYFSDTYNNATDKMDFNAIIESFAKACDKKVDKVCNILSDMYFRGKGVKLDIDKGIQYYEKECKNSSRYYNNVNYNVPDDLFLKYASMYENGTGGVKKDIETASIYYARACDSNIYEACERLSDMYFKGEGVKFDIDKGSEYYKKTCKSGSSIYRYCDNISDLYYNYGSSYYSQGEDIAKAKEFFIKGCDNGASEACFKLANIYYQYEKNDGKAQEYVKKCHDLGGDKCDRYKEDWINRS